MRAKGEILSQQPATQRPLYSNTMGLNCQMLLSLSYSVSYTHSLSLTHTHTDCSLSLYQSLLKHIDTHLLTQYTCSCPLTTPNYTNVSDPISQTFQFNTHWFEPISSNSLYNRRSAPLSLYHSLSENYRPFLLLSGLQCQNKGVGSASVRAAPKQLVVSNLLLQGAVKIGVLQNLASCTFAVLWKCPEIILSHRLSPVGRQNMSLIEEL